MPNAVPLAPSPAPVVGALARQGSASIRGHATAEAMGPVRLAAERPIALGSRPGLARVAER